MRQVGVVLEVDVGHSYEKEEGEEKVLTLRRCRC